MSVDDGLLEPGEDSASALKEAEQALTNASTDRDEASKVYAWRLTYLLRTGLIEVADAEALARSGCDLHAAAEMLVAGCPAATAVAILS